MYPTILHMLKDWWISLKNLYKYFKIGPGLVTFFLPTSKSIFLKEHFACIVLFYVHCCLQPQLSQVQFLQDLFSYKTILNHPLPKQKYGNGMGLLGPYLTHRWEWYGKVTWVYGIGMGPNFTKFLTMGHAWEENRRLLILWETYGNKVPIHIPYQ